MKKIFAGLMFLLFSLSGCSEEGKVSEPITESIESELFRLQADIPSALLYERLNQFLPA